jgi:hypothetical protein
MGLGSDSARVNEVAKLCRAVVRGCRRRESSEGSSAGVERELDVGWLKGWCAEDKSCRLAAFNEPIDREIDRSRESVYHCVRWVRSSV